ncbi:MAG: hypothetical protein ACLRNI_10885, partial [Sutterella wadsworthensis]
VYAVAPGRADRGRVFAGLRRHFAVASYRDIPAEKLGDVLRVISAYKLAKDAPAPQAKPQPKPEPAAKPASTREQRHKQLAIGTITAFDIIYDRLVELVCDDEKDWPPQKVTRALDDMAKNASILEAWLTLQSAR